MFMGMPKHHIDTSVIVEPENTDEGRQCKRYLQKVNYNYKGVLPFPVLSELFLIFASSEDFNARYDFAEPLLGTIKARCIDFYSPKDIACILNKIRIADSRIGSTDREILACAVEDNADALITIDKEMLNNRRLENLLGIKIIHPKDLL